MKKIIFGITIPVISLFFFYGCNPDPVTPVFPKNFTANIRGDVNLDYEGTCNANHLYDNRIINFQSSYKYNSNSYRMTLAIFFPDSNKKAGIYILSDSLNYINPCGIATFSVDGGKAYQSDSGIINIEDCTISTGKASFSFTAKEIDGTGRITVTDGSFNYAIKQ